MSPTEIGLIVGIGSSVFTAGVVWGVSNYRTRTHTRRINVIESDVKNHLADDNPHRTCAVHGMELKNLAENVAKLVIYHDTLDDRIYRMLTNGGGKGGKNA